MVSTLLLDLGNVLLYFSHDRMFEQVGTLCNWSKSDVRDLFTEHRIITEFECGRMSQADVHRLFESVTGCQVDRRRLMRAISNIFTPNEPLLRILDPLKAAGLRLVLLSNTNAAHYRFIQKQFDLLPKFDELVLSYKVGAMKPDPPIYEAALKAIQCEPHECFYTDDIVENVDRARGFGLQAEVFIDTQTFLAQLQKRNILLRDLHKSE